MIGTEIIRGMDFFLIIGLELVSAFCFTDLVDWMFSTTVADDGEKSSAFLLIESTAIVTSLMVIAYYVKKIIQMIPFPFMGAFGYNKRVYEFKTLALIVMFSVQWSTTIQQKISILRGRLVL